MNMKNYFSIFFKGIMMGMADLVPGVSGGTIAFLTGIYARLLAAIGAIPNQIPFIFKGKIILSLKNMDAYFLITLISGIGFSILVFSRSINYLLHTYPVLLNAFFLGLILASTLFIYKQNKLWNFINILFCILAFLLAYVVVHLPVVQDVSINLWYIFFCATLAICAMILPGISGSFILVVLGVYGAVLDALNDLNWSIIATFLAGAVFGLLSFARIVSYLFKYHPTATSSVLTGFLLGSLPKIWPWKNTLSFRINSKGVAIPIETENVSPSIYKQLTNIDLEMGLTDKEPYIFLAVALVFFGFFLVLFIEKMAKKNNI
jgi:putative membrane protein